ncbi:MAG: hypothetical protein V3U75_04255 [Methylococcaceae bacterium]
MPENDLEHPKTETIKKCATCKQDKDISLFGRDARGHDGLHYSCKVCKNLIQVKSYNKHKDKHLKQREEYYRANRPAILKKEGKVITKKEHGQYGEIAITRGITASQKMIIIICSLSKVVVAQYVVDTKENLINVLL